MIREKPVLSMINKYNIADLSLKNREVAGTKRGFGAVVPNHDANHGARYFDTENRTNFGQPAQKNPASAQAEFQATQNKSSGGINRPIDAQKLKTLSNLTGEIYNEKYDPQGQTDVQRSWLYQEDPSLRAARVGQKDQVSMLDNANSLCMGDGVWNLREFSNANGAGRHMRQDVTL